MTDYLTLNDVDTYGRRVLVRCDLNTPLSQGEVTDDFRIRASLKAVKMLRDRGAVVVLCSHLGRPKGPDPRFSLAPVARCMGELGGFPVRHLPVVAGSEAKEAISQGRPQDVFLLENTRFHPGETANDPKLSHQLADLADLFCQNAFGSAHRAHASTVGVAERLRSVAGPLMVSELESMRRLLQDPPTPFVVILGGAKVSDKLGVLSALVERCDVLVIGGAMSFTALLAEGLDVGKSLVEKEIALTVRDLLRGPQGGKFLLPEDVVAAKDFRPDARHRVSSVRSISEDEMGLDIGPATAGRIAGLCQGAGTIFWNGPMGVFEWEAFRRGTETVAEAVASSRAFSVVGGGDSAAAMRLLGLDSLVSHLSTGGGAGLRLLEGTPLPGVEVLKRWVP